MSAPASTRLDTLLGAVFGRATTITRLSKVDGQWREAVPGVCAKCGGVTPPGWVYCSRDAVELGRR